MTRTRTFTVVLATLLPVLVASAQSGCKKETEEAKPVVSAAPPPPPPTAPAVVTPEEDAGADADAGDASDAKVVTGGGAASQIGKCCAALAQNANSAPLDQKGAYLAAAAACNGLRNMPVATQAFGQIRAFLAGAKMPGACQ